MDCTQGLAVMAFAGMSMIVYGYGWMYDTDQLIHHHRITYMSWIAFTAMTIISFLAGSFPVH